MHIGTGPFNFNKKVSPEAVLEAHRRARSRLGTTGRRAGHEEHRPDGRVGCVHRERASPAEHPCPPGTPWCLLRGIPAG